jgi:threonine/homoserine/homoserine lactone efflux protein
MTALLALMGMTFIISFSGAIMPGPVLTVTISEVTKRGFISAPLIVLGHAIIELVLLILLMIGLSHFIKSSLVLGTIGILGCGALIWMGIGMLRDVRHLTLDLDKVEDVKSSPVVAGILTSLANPYFTIWWATIGLKLISDAMTHNSAAGWVFFYVGHIGADMTWYCIVGLFISMGRKFISNNVYRGIIAVCAVLLLVFGVYFGYSGVLLLNGTNQL